MLIDSFSLDCIEKLRSRASNLPPAYSIYMLVDGAFREGIHKIFPDEEKRILFDLLPSCSTKTRDVSPFLIGFNPLDKRIGVLLGRCSGWPMVSAIETTESLSVLSIRLAAWCIVEADSSRFNFRFADTRRIPAIFRVLTSKQKASFLGPAANWSFIRRDGEWEIIVIREQSYQPHPPISDPCLEISQFNALIEDSRADEILAVMAYRGEKPGRASGRIWGSIVAALKISVRANLTDVDTVEWAIWYANNHHDEVEAKLPIMLQEWVNMHCIIERDGECASEPLSG
ncbi:DUF4123 domain-containing protein [Telluria aromaticivorans]|uniref:DUF4123 domain-containing protein n=1 Tax=Telluria aromaticivorans TaxID=2725995 RepID=A0A7Y2NZ77_9BURK|nr:DUF4123 domain-containing protein [Telluria aromaticivorans]NNG22764.1 DUF4123 domain-containing protein [Telluria aromaticivorans]